MIFGSCFSWESFVQERVEGLSGQGVTKKMEKRESTTTGERKERDSSAERFQLARTKDLQGRRKETLEEMSSIQGTGQAIINRYITRVLHAAEILARGDFAGWIELFTYLLSIPSCLICGRQRFQGKSRCVMDLGFKRNGT